MGVQLVALEFDAQDPVAMAQFWAPLLRREIDGSGTCLPGVLPTDFAIHFAPAEDPNAARHRMHFDLTSSSPQEQQHSVELALNAGARPLDVGQRDDEGHVVLADPEGNEFCVVGAGNGFLADTARIGALAGDGVAEVGYFWSQALQWPLVWDQDGGTAIQAPGGGTKITWGGPPVSPKNHPRNRLRWVLATREPLAVETARLTAMGATVVHGDATRAELVDPEANEFILQSG